MVSPHTTTITEDTSALVVDDDEKFRNFIRAGLADSGIRCEVAADGMEALAILDDPDQGPFDVVLLDIMMPGMTGWDTLAAIRQRVGVPVVFVTARESVDERVRGLRLGADDYIIKRIFRPFFQGPARRRKRIGYGLGLAIAQSAVDNHGGHIAAQTSPLGGARFCMTFRRTKSPAIA